MRADTGKENWLGPIVDLVYDAALDDGKWACLAPAIARVFGAPSAVLKTCGSGSGPQLESVTDNLRVTASERPWADYWHRNDLWVERSAELGLEVAFTSQRLMVDSLFERTGFYQDWTRKLDVYHMVGVLFSLDGPEIGVLGVHRPKGAGPFGEEDRRKVEALFPHVRRAIGIRHRLQGADVARCAALQALERLETGLVVVDEARTVLFANRAAEQTLGSACGIRTRNGQLSLDDSGLNLRLARLVQEAARTARGECRPPGSVIALARPERLPVTLLVSPWRAEWAATDVAHPAAMIFIRDPEAFAPTASRTLMELFGMTHAEAIVAAAVGQGQSLERIAAAQGIGLGTVRTHLKKVLSKTGTGRQGALAALVAHSVAGISAQK